MSVGGKYVTAYTGGYGISGFRNVGNIAVDTNPGSGDYSLGNFIGGVMSSYDSTGYIIITDTSTAGVVGRTTGNNSGIISQPNQPTFWVSPTKDDTGFLYLVNRLPERAGQTPFTEPLLASTWLSSNGYWSTYITPLLSLDADTYGGSGNWIDSVSGNQFTLHSNPVWTSPNEGSIYFNGTDKFISTTVNSPGQSSTTYEWWFYQTNNTGNQGMLQTRTNSYNNDGIDVSISSGSITVSTYGTFLFTGGTVYTNTWYHIAICRNGASSWTLYLDGQNIGTFTYTDTTGTELVIGRKEVSGTFFNGYISNFRYVKGVEVYPAPFTPPTNHLTVTQSSDVNGNPSSAITLNTQTQLLLKTFDGANFLQDSSSYNNSVSNPNGVTSSNVNPIKTISSGYFNFKASSGQYAGSSTSLSSLNNWTVAVWHYYTGNNTGTSPNIVSEVYTGGYINYVLGNGNDTSPNLQTGFWAPGWILTNNGYTLTPGNWYYIVGTYDGYTLSLYVNNTLVESTSGLVYNPQSSNSGIFLMSRWDNQPNELWDGYLATVDIYDQALDSTKVTSIWNSTKSRFGL
jgi:hypothetical protein